MNNKSVGTIFFLIAAILAGIRLEENEQEYLKN